MPCTEVAPERVRRKAVGSRSVLTGERGAVVSGGCALFE